MSRYTAEHWLHDLTTFQRRSVDHVIEQFYGPSNARRFLVADETGLGKTRVAQGVIARAIEHLQDDVKRIDIVYVCANADLARQNVRRLNVSGQGEIPFSSRLTLLGEHSRRLNRSKNDGGGINLVSFTPGTSFDMGHSLGQARERAMIAVALMEIYDLDGYQRTATARLLQGTVRTLAGFRQQIGWLLHDLGERGIDPAIRKEYRRRLFAGGRSGLGGRFETFLSDMGRKQSIPVHLRGDALNLVRDLRRSLAAASVETLEPDLIILDEFQRFRHLLTEDTAAGELAHDLFGYESAKVLLLSATPYKPFTLADEESEDHARDLFRTLEFLARGRTDVDLEDIRSGLRSYREALLANAPATETTASLRRDLLKLMSRAERPSLTSDSMSVERLVDAADLRAADLTDFATMRQVADLVRLPRDQSLVNAEYWKSAPYFITFSDGYQLGRRLREADPSTELRSVLDTSHHVARATLEHFRPLEVGNARMRVLADQTIENDWWKLLWMPPSLSYIEPSGPFADEALRTMTKRLVFSSWTATPSSVASILSYEAERRAVEGSDSYTAYTPEVRARVARRLQYTATGDGRPRQMAALLCFWPFRGLATSIDPLDGIATNDGRPLSQTDARAAAFAAVSTLLDVPHARAVGRDGEAPSSSTSDQDRIWRIAFSRADSWPETSDHDIAAAMSGAADADDHGAEVSGDADNIANGLSHHLSSARSALNGGSPEVDVEALEVLGELALYSPANIAYRSLSRLSRGSTDVSASGLFQAAATIANGVRSLFNRPDVIQLVDRLVDDRVPYWRKMLAYIASGDFEAVVDEYLFQLFSDRSNGTATDEVLLDISREVAEALSLRSPTLRALDVDDLTENLAFAARFALRYGGRQQDAEDARQPEVRRAFNSPFWPFVLASTSVGQEGIDFHWWCHAVFHWNTPSNPVDFEQREGRVDRYRGHAVRKNVAARHGHAALSQTDEHPWSRLFDLATDHRDELGDFSPGWVYPGENRIERHLAPFPFSTDIDRYDRMKRDVALYRLTFGQPRQEDLLDALRRRGVEADLEGLQRARVNLAP